MKGIGQRAGAKPMRVTRPQDKMADSLERSVRMSDTKATKSQSAMNARRDKGGRSK